MTSRSIHVTEDGSAGDEPVIYVIDDDVGVREALARLFRSVGLRAELFASANDFLRAKPRRVPSCLVVDIRMPGLSGFELHAELTRADIPIPVIFITAHGDIPMSVRAMKAGAVDFIPKPFRDQDMLDGVAAAINRDRERLDKERAQDDTQKLFDSLTSRQREIMALVTAGLMNKQVAADVGISEVTVKIHRMHAMKKMHAKSLADLVRMADALGIDRAKRP
jgi:FixJ family two-component response regulator